MLIAMRRMRLRRVVMINRVMVLILMLSTVPLLAIKDNDFDGVNDAVDECPNTPFLANVSANGCVTKILTLPSETESDSLQAVLGYGVIINEDLFGREELTTSTLQINYYKNNWTYSANIGRYNYANTQGMLDSTFKVKKRFTLLPKLKLDVGGGLKLPTYNFQGNKTDYIVYGSLTYYPIKSLSLFSHFKHTFVQDKEVNASLQDSQYITGGLGYFMTQNFYVNAAYTEGRNKFSSQHDIKSISSTLYYKFNKKWFALFAYHKEIEDEDAHDTYNLKVGYKVW